MKDLKEIPGPKLLHVLTVKGQRGISRPKSISAPGTLRGCSKPKRANGSDIRETGPRALSDVVRRTLLELARRMNGSRDYPCDA
ncbi:MAG: hypothetical protein ACLR8Y_11795 [Alistipes indistinctus]